MVGGGEVGGDKDISWISGVDAALGCILTMVWSFDVCKEVMRSIFPWNISSGMVFGVDTGDLSDLRVLAVLRFDVFLETSSLISISRFLWRSDIEDYRFASCCFDSTGSVERFEGASGSATVTLAVDLVFGSKVHSALDAEGRSP
jgi:hypothetical protein